MPLNRQGGSYSCRLQLENSAASRVPGLAEKAFRLCKVSTKRCRGAMAGQPGLIHAQARGLFSSRLVGNVTLTGNAALYSSERNSRS